MLFSIAINYLPVQAISIPCKHVFSLAKNIDTAKWNQISPVLMEALQMLKYLLKKEHLNFMKGWSTLEKAAMIGAWKATGDLNSLFIDNSNTALDALLKVLNNYNWLQVLTPFYILCPRI